MLDIIRSNAQSLGVKIAFGVIILVFVFWGIGSFTDRGNINVVASVNDEPITYQQFETAFRAAEESVNRQQPGRTWTPEEKTRLGRQVFQRLVSELMVNQEARRVSLGVSPYELRMHVGKIQAFQDEQGRFDPERYKSMLAGRRQSAAQFEAELSRQILQEKMVAFIAGGIWTDGVEARNFFNFLRQKRVADYVYVPADSESVAAYQPSDEELAAYYEEHKADYAVPQKAEVQYIVVDPMKLVDPASVSEEEARAWYERNVDRFREPESWETSHILVQLAPDAPQEEVARAEEKLAAIQKELASGKPFAEVADRHNPPNAAGRGGSLGWVSAGQTVPAFESAVMAAEPGVVTAPVRSPFGLHLVLVSARREASVKPFEQVASEARTALAQETGKSRLSDVLDVLTEENILGKPLDEAARAQGLRAETTALLSADELVAQLGVKPEGARGVLSTGEGQPVDIPLEAGQTYVVARGLKSAPASYRDMAEAREDLVSRIRSERGLAEARRQLEELAREAGQGELPEAWRSRVQVSSPVDRGEAMAPFHAQAELASALFSAAPGAWLPAVFSVESDGGRGALIARVKEVRDPSDEEWGQFEQVILNLRMRERSEGVFTAFMESLSSRSKVVVRNQDIIDRKNL